jgi:multiple sugar transport system substrate-binding protein
MREVPLGLNPTYRWLDILPVYHSRLLLWGRRTYALPLLGSAPLCCYRSDLLQDQAHQQAFQAKYGRSLTPPATWDDFADIAEYFSGRMGKPGVAASLPPFPATDEEINFDFYSMAAPLARRAAREDQRPLPTEEELFSFHYDFNTLEPRIAGPGFVAALRLLQRLQSHRSAEETAQPAVAFRDGHVVLCLAGGHWLGRFQEEGSPVRGRFSVCRMPGSKRVFDFYTGQPRTLADVNYVPYLGSEDLLAIVPRSSSAPEAAFSLLTDLSAQRVSGEIVLDPAWPGGVFRQSHLEILTAADPLELGPSRHRAWVEALRQSLSSTVMNPAIAMRTSNHRQHERILAQEIRNAVLHSKDAQQALTAVADQWRQLDRTKNEKARRAEYRLSLNLKEGD